MADELTLVEFLRARLDEDERVAQVAQLLAGSRWKVAPYEPSEPGAFPTGTWIEEDSDSDSDSVHGVAVASGTYVARHIACHDPVRVLAEVEAKRAVIDRVFGYEATIDGEWGCCHSVAQIANGECPETDPSEIPALRLLALPYATHPDYQESWRP